MSRVCRVSCRLIWQPSGGRLGCSLQGSWTCRCHKASCTTLNCRCVLQHSIGQHSREPGSALRSIVQHSTTQYSTPHRTTAVCSATAVRGTAEPSTSQRRTLPPGASTHPHDSSQTTKLVHYFMSPVLLHMLVVPACFLQVMPPEVAVVRLLRWASDRKAAIQLAMQHAELAGQLLAAHNQ